MDGSRFDVSGASKAVWSAGTPRAPAWACFVGALSVLLGFLILRSVSAGWEDAREPDSTIHITSGGPSGVVSGAASAEGEPTRLTVQKADDRVLTPDPTDAMSTGSVIDASWLAASLLGEGRLVRYQDQASGGGLGETQTLGKAPEDYSLEFLRRQTVLLKPGQHQFDFGISYLIEDQQVPVWFEELNDVANLRIRQRLLMVPFEIRYGLTPKIQLFTSFPVGWSNTEIAVAGVDDYDNVGGIGDVSAGFSTLLRRGYRHQPDVVGTFAFTAPTGNAGISLLLLDPTSVLGDGFWALSADVLWIHSYDPVIVFYGLGARFRFSHTFLDTVDVDPGAQYSYRFGVGFAVNDRMTLSTAIMGSYIAADHINGVRIAGGELEPLRLRFAWTIGRPCNRVVEPFAEIGMTRDAPDARVGVVWTY
jgi:hypothetical protein